MCVCMTNPADPTLTLKTIFEARWNTANSPTPKFYTPAETKRIDSDTQDVVQFYSVTRVDKKEGVSNAYRDRVDVVSIDFETFEDYAHFMAMRCEVERIIDLATTRSSPTTRPMVATYADSYTANQYDQIVPISSYTWEDRNRRWYRCRIEVEMRTFWEAR